MPLKKVTNLWKRYPWAGAILWGASLQYFAIQFTAADRARHYSAIRDTISDLGLTSCKSLGGQYFCSPLHGWVDGSFMALGLAVIIGVIIMIQRFGDTFWRRAGFLLLGLAGAGVLAVGLSPSNVNHLIHFLGANTAFIAGSLSMLILALSLALRRPLKLFILLLGAISLAASVLINIHPAHWAYLGIAERLATDPQLLWMMILGAYTSFRLYGTRRQDA